MIDSALEDIFDIGSEKKPITLTNYTEKMDLQSFYDLFFLVQTKSPNQVPSSKLVVSNEQA